MARTPLFPRSGNLTNWALSITQRIERDHAEVNSLLQKVLSIVSVTDYGAVGDGVTDDTTAVRAAIDAAVAAGGEVWFPYGTYLITSGMTFTSPANVHFRTAGATIRARLTQTENVWSFLDANHVTIEGFIFDGGWGVTGFSRQIISFRDPANCMVKDCYFTDWERTAALIFSNDRNSTGASTNNHFINCVAVSTTGASAGFIMESTDRSSIVNCWATGCIGNVTGPNYGLEFKNHCTRCSMIGGGAYNCEWGVTLVDDGSMGGTGTGSANCIVKGTIAVGCEKGLGANYLNNCHIEMMIDGESVNTAGTDTRGADIGAHSSPSSFDLSFTNLGADATAVSVRSDYQTINIRYYDDSGTGLLLLQSGVEYARVTLHTLITNSTTLDPRSLITDDSGKTSNQFAYLGDLFLGHLSGSSNSIYFSLNGYNRSTNSLRIDTANQCVMRMNGIDAFNFKSSTTLKILSGTGSPNTVVTANPGSIYMRTDGGAGFTLYVKETGVGNVGWAAK